MTEEEREEQIEQIEQIEEEIGGLHEDLFREREKHWLARCAAYDAGERPPKAPSARTSECLTQIKQLEAQLAELQGDAPVESLEDYGLLELLDMIPKGIAGLRLHRYVSDLLSTEISLNRAVIGSEEERAAARRYFACGGPHPFILGEAG